MNTELHDVLGYDLSDGFWVGYEVSDMRVICPFCGEKLAVYSRHTVSNELARAYARCSNKECEKHGFKQVHNLSFSHCIEPKPEMVQDLFEVIYNQLPAQHKKELIDRLRAS